MPVPHLGFVMLFVANPIESSVFYTRLLNLKPLEESPTFAMFALPNDVMLGLWSPATAAPKVTGQPGSSEIAFSEENVDQLYEKWLNFGVKVVQPPTEMDFGRTFVILDPDGHRIRIYRLNEEHQ